MTDIGVETFQTFQGQYGPFVALLIVLVIGVVGVVVYLVRKANKQAEAHKTDLAELRAEYKVETKTDRDTFAAALEKVGASFDAAVKTMATEMEEQRRTSSARESLLLARLDKHAQAMDKLREAMPALCKG